MQWYLAVTVALSVVTCIAVIAAALLIADILAGVITDPAKREIGIWRTELVILTIAVAVRVVAAGAQARFGDRAAARTIAELQSRVLTAAARRNPRDVDSAKGDWATLLTKGLADLLPYLAGYLPALMLSVIVPPTVLVAILTQDVVSAAIVAVTLPLIPVFMVLIGLLTRGKADATLASMSTLTAQLLDLLTGLPTLRALGREQGPRERVTELGDAHRRTAMSALRIAFLSSMVLELLATLCVALVAVSIGLRLVYGEMALQAGIAALILAPEVYQPLRAVGERFHAAEDGMAAARAAFEVLDEPEHAAKAHGGAIPARLEGRIELRGIGIRSRDGWAPESLDAVLAPGRVTVLTGPNGAGKSTALLAILGLVEPDTGRVSVDGTDLAALDAQWWCRHVAWLPARPVLLAGTVRENVELLGSRDGDLESCCTATGFDAVLADLPQGWATRLGTGGIGLSLGQRQRLALTRVLVANKPVLLLDEPTAHLDAVSAARVLAALQARAHAGATVVLVAHDERTLTAADAVIGVHGRAAVGWRADGE
ncbi:thiol reductant ABC exporter subunit CydD [Aldersonia sp. NBC_00410]|uniref:thiol reductant ABC exporter subunit CydD n=1 Tax=Aldersonia sp. NBC_00410 TaxID=2975954 RepID=UPI00225B8245|nr:thiol reductant ABC exporter subunit CydD [Aldersonia sp. NBC_00410]MCX5043441.1 thiol reductant ABC exporter subunit CydD [Aldersonia sp. NBC_00410]